MSNSKELQILEQSSGLKLFIYSSVKKYPSPYETPIQIIGHLDKIEKKLFPKSEQMNFSKELKSNNSTLIYSLDKTNPNQVIAYLVYQYNPYDKLFRLIKIGIDARNQRKGYATILMNCMINLIKLKSSRFGIQLHVDVGRDEAIGLYKKFGFEILETVEDYYGSGRAAFLMAFANRS